MSAWHDALCEQVQALAPPPNDAVVNDIEEDRQARDGRNCRECGDVGAGVVLRTASQQSPENAQVFHWYQAIFDGTLADLLDAVEAGALDLAWTRHRL